MFQKINTIKARITILSLLIMIATVSSIVLTEYMLQRNLTQVMINMSDVAISNGTIPSNKNDLTKEEIIVGTSAIIQQRQQTKFIWLASISSMILMIGIGSIYILIKKELQPLENLRRDMDKMDIKTSNKELLIPQSNRTEILSLTNSYNKMIDNLKESYDLQKRFSQDAAHELKTPITTMKTSLQVNKMLSQVNEEETEQLLEVLEGQVERMDQLVAGLLTISNQKTLKVEPVQVNEVIVDIRDSYQKMIEDKQLEVSIEGTCEIVTDRNILTIILKNLFENAIRYNKQKGSITVTLNKDISIKDTGIGISKSNQERIFSPFYCVDESRSKSLGGIGLGLSIVKESIQQLGFELNLESELGVGSTFIVKTSMGENQ